MSESERDPNYLSLRTMACVELRDFGNGRSNFSFVDRGALVQGRSIFKSDCCDRRKLGTFAFAMDRFEWSANLGWPTSKAASRLAALGAASFILSALFPVLPVYVITCVIGMSTSSAAIPLLTQMYQENYPEQQRGRRFSRSSDDSHCDGGGVQRIGRTRFDRTHRKFSMAAAGLCRRVRLRQFLFGSMSNSQTDANQGNASVSRAAICPRRSGIPTDADLLDVDGFRDADDAAVARGISGQPKI